MTQAQPYDDRAAPAAARRPPPRRSTPRRARARRGRCSPTASAGSPCASCSTATASPPSFVVEIEEDGSPDAALRRRRPRARSRRPAPSSRRRTGSARAGPATSAPASLTPRRHRRSTVDGGLRTRCRRRAAPTPSRSSRSGCTRRRRSARRSGRSPWPTTRRSPSGTPRCRRPAPRGAGPGAGTRSSSPSTAAAAAPIDDAFEDELRAFLDPFRLAGHDLEIDAPALRRRSSSQLSVCVAPGYVRSNVKAALLEAFSSDAARRPARLLPSRQLHVRPAGLPQPDRRRRDGRRRRRVGRGHARSSATASRPRAELERRRAAASAGSRSRGSTTTRAGPRTAGSRSS